MKPRNVVLIALVGVLSFLGLTQSPSLANSLGPALRPVTGHDSVPPPPRAPKRPRAGVPPSPAPGTATDPAVRIAELEHALEAAVRERDQLRRIVEHAAASPPPNREPVAPPGAPQVLWPSHSAEPAGPPPTDPQPPVPPSVRVDARAPALVAAPGIATEAPEEGQLQPTIQSRLDRRVPFIWRESRAPRFPADNETHWYMTSDMSPAPEDVVVYHWVTTTDVQYHFTFALDRQALRRALAPLMRRSAQRLVIVTFANLKYADVFMNWLAALHRLRLQNYCIFAIDPDTKAWLEARQVPTFGVYIKRFAALWYVRLIVLRALAEVGVTFIHSDTDAIWLRDPLGAFFAPTQPALLKFSQGTVAPSQLQARWGFVVCGGLFYARASRFTRAYFQTVLEHLLQNPLVPRHATDQDSLNLALAEFGVAWHTVPNTTYHKKLFATHFTCSLREVEGTFEGAGLRVALLPHHFFMRRPMVHPEKPYVLHLYTHGGPKQTAGKLKMLQSEGLQFLRTDWANVSFPGDRGAWLDSLLLVNATVRSRYWP